MTKQRPGAWVLHGHTGRSWATSMGTWAFAELQLAWRAPWSWHGGKIMRQFSHLHSSKWHKKCLQLYPVWAPPLWRLHTPLHDVQAQFLLFLGAVCIAALRQTQCSSFSLLFFPQHFMLMSANHSKSKKAAPAITMESAYKWWNWPTLY